MSSSIQINGTSIRGKKVSGHKKAAKSGCQMVETRNSEAILNIVNEGLSGKYSTTAVHTFSEMNYLSNKFKKNIRIFDFIIVECFSRFQEVLWFDFGISTENDGRTLNYNLIKAKEEFNMSAVCYDTYIINL